MYRTGWWYQTPRRKKRAHTHIYIYIYTPYIYKREIDLFIYNIYVYIYILIYVFLCMCTGICQFGVIIPHKGTHAYSIFDNIHQTGIYRITCRKALDQWFYEILQTCVFIWKHDYIYGSKYCVTPWKNKGRSPSRRRAFFNARRL